MKTDRRKAFLSSFRSVSALGADVMDGQIIGFNLASEVTLDRLRKGGKVEIADLSATVAEQMVVRLYDLVKAVCRAVDVETVDHACLVHGVEIVINGSHRNTGHFQLCEEENFIGCQVTVGMIEDI